MSNEGAARGERIHFWKWYAHLDLPALRVRPEWALGIGRQLAHTRVSTG